MTRVHTLVVLLSFAAAFGRAQAGWIPEPDSIRAINTVRGADTLWQADSLREAEPDSILKVIPIGLVGSVEPAEDSLSTLRSAEIPWLEYRSLSDLLARKPDVYIRDMGSPGQNDQLTIMGVDPRSIAFLVDGRSEADPITGAYDMALFPVEFVDRIEIITGPRAMLYGPNATGGTVNVVTKSYYTNRPISQLRYSQGLYSYTQTDAVFTQNLFRRFNFMFGLTRQAYGQTLSNIPYAGRFENANDDAWTFRTRLRYDVTNAFNLVFTHLYQQTWTGLNGGVDLSRTDLIDVYNEAGATVVNPDSYEKRFNNHLDLTAVALLGPDSSRVLRGTVYYSNQLREYRDEENRAAPNGLYRASDHRTSVRGAVLRHTWTSHLQTLDLSAEYENTRVESSPEVGSRAIDRLGASAKEEITLGSAVTAAIFGRADRYQEEVLGGAGADLHLRFGEDVLLYAGFSASSRTPTLQELYWSSDTLQRPTPRTWLVNEEHKVTEGSIDVRLTSWLRGRVSVSHREIANPISVDTQQVAGSKLPLILFRQDHSMTIDGISASAEATLGHFVAEGMGTYLRYPKVSHAGASLTLFPEFHLDGSVYYRNHLFADHLELKVGARGRLVTRQDGMGPLTPSELFVPGTQLAYGPTGTADIFLVAHLGDAYIHIIWENVTNNAYFIVPVYPMDGSNIRFGVTWEFLD